MKNIKSSLTLLLICVMIAGSGCNENKATKTITVQLVGRKFDRLILEGKPYRADFTTPTSTTPTSTTLTSTTLTATVPVPAITDS